METRIPFLWFTLLKNYFNCNKDISRNSLTGKKGDNHPFEKVSEKKSLIMYKILIFCKHKQILCIINSPYETPKTTSKTPYHPTRRDKIRKFDLEGRWVHEYLSYA